MQTRKKARNDVDGVHGVVNESDMEGQWDNKCKQVLKIWPH
jgi:hypothetical protein